MTHVARWRMNVAARLLSESDVSVEEAALAVGYTNVPAFSRAFKRSLGLPPTRYRSGER